MVFSSISLYIIIFGISCGHSSSVQPCNLVVTTARKIGFALFLICIKHEVKYNNIFDNMFDVHQKYVKYVTPLHIPLTRIKSEFKCINNFDPTFDARQIEIKLL